MLIMNATKRPNIIPGIEKYKLLSKIIVIKYGFLKPRARSIPNSYVLLSTSVIIKAKTRVVASIASRIITVKPVAFKKS